MAPGLMEYISRSLFKQCQNPMLIDLFADTAAILISIVSNSYYGMPRGKYILICPLSIPQCQIKMAAVSAKRSITQIDVLGCFVKRLMIFVHIWKEIVFLKLRGIRNS